jgi:hypothetical protein
METSYNQDMTDAVREVIVRAAESRGETLASLSRKLGKNHAYLQQFVKRGIPAELPERVRYSLANLLQIDEHALRNGDGERKAAAGRSATGVAYRAPPLLLGSRDLKVFAAVEGGSGTMVVSTEPIEVVPRPWYLREVKDGFGVLVVGESMVPAYEPGDIAIVNPRLPPMRGKDVILISGEQAGEFTATIKRLEKWTATHWHLRQFNPSDGQKETFTLSKVDWPKVYRVVGKYAGG